MFDCSQSLLMVSAEGTRLFGNFIRNLRLIFVHDFLPYMYSLWNKWWRNSWWWKVASFGERFTRVRCCYVCCFLLSSNRETKFSLYAVLVWFVLVEQSVKCSLCDDAGPGSILAREECFLNNTFNFHRAYTLPGFINFNLQRGKTYIWVGST